MRPTNLHSRRPRLLIWTLGALGLVALLSSSTWAGAWKTPFKTTVGAMLTIDPGLMLTDGVRLYITGGRSTYDEDASDPRISGPALVTVNAAFEFTPQPVGPPLMTGPVWSTARRERGDGGVWVCHWVGTRTAFVGEDGLPHVRSRIKEIGVGQGAYEGLVARWEISAVDAETGNPFVGGGYILAAKGGPGERPMRWRSEGMESVGLFLGMMLPPSEPPEYGALITWEIVDETGQASHLGRATNHGLGLLNPLTGEVTGSGTVRSASGDELDWVATGWSLGPSGPVDLTLHWAGGSGRLDAAVGEITGNLVLQPTADPGIMDLDLEAEGFVQY